MEIMIIRKLMWYRLIFNKWNNFNKSRRIINFQVIMLIKLSFRMISSSNSSSMKKVERKVSKVK